MLLLGFDNEIVEVYIEPPEANVLTDEDSADDDMDVNHLSGNQLCAPAVIVTKKWRLDNWFWCSRITRFK